MFPFLPSFLFAYFLFFIVSFSFVPLVSLFLYFTLVSLYFLLISVFFCLSIPLSFSFSPFFLSLFLHLFSFLLFFFLSGYDSSCYMMLLKIINSKIAKTILEEGFWFSPVLLVVKPFQEQTTEVKEERYELQCWM